MTIIYNKKSSLYEIRNILNQEKPSSILLIRGNSSYEESGARNILEPQLENYNVVHLHGFKKSPYLEDVERTIDLIRRENVDFIIGVGGGTVMDIAKAASLLNCESDNKQ